MSIKPISLVILAVICVVAGRIEKAHSATRFAGAYFGSFSTSCGDGTFALLAYPDGRLIILAEQATGAGVVDHRANDVVNPDGSFQISGFLGRNSTIVALLEPGKVEGEILGPDCPGVVSGTKEPAEGFFMDLGGYYTGSTEGTRTIFACVDPGFFIPFCGPGGAVKVFEATYRGNLFSIMRADGFSYLLFERTEFTIVFSNIHSVPEVESEADIIRIRLFFGTYGIDCSIVLDFDFFPIIGCSFGTGRVTGVLDAQIFTLSGTLTLPGGFFSAPSGPYQLTRAAPLPKPPITAMPWLQLLLLDD